MFTKVEVFGEVPLARFGHTITQGNILTNITPVVSKSKVILFGGATGDTGKYIITGDTYALDIIGNKWSKIEGKYLILLTFRFRHCTVPESCSRKLLR
jgi:protein phosphatase